MEGADDSENGVGYGVRDEDEADVVVEATRDGDLLSELVVIVDDDVNEKSDEGRVEELSLE
jgi:hypothetical protein